METTKKEAKTKRIRPVLKAALESKAKGGLVINVGFMRAEKYAISALSRPPTKAGRSRPPAQTIAAVLNEAGRLAPEGYRHLLAQGLEPKPPRTLYGLGPGELWSWYDAHKARASENKVEQRFAHKTILKRQPTNITTAIGCVCSYPGEPNDMDLKYQKWKRLVAAWALEHFGAKNVVSILEHIDEQHGHIHILVAKQDATNVAMLHAPTRARESARRTGAATSQLGEQYRAGGRAMQSEFFAKVSQHMNWARAESAQYDRYDYAESRLRKKLAADIAGVDAQLNLRKRYLESQESKVTAMQLAFERAMQTREMQLKKVEDINRGIAKTLESEKQTLKNQRELLTSNLKNIQATVIEYKHAKEAAEQYVSNILSRAERMMTSEEFKFLTRVDKLDGSSTHPRQ